MTTNSEQILGRFQSEIPNAHRARVNDTRYQDHVELMRRLLAIADLEMENQGVPESARQTVLRAIVYGGLDPAEAIRRIEQMQVMTEAIEKGAFSRHAIQVLPGDKPRVERVTFDG